MNKNSNIYVILYSAVMVIIVAIGLAFTSELLKDRQQANANIDTMRQILSALHIEASANEAEELYAKTIVEAYVVNDKGEVISGSEGTKATDAAFLIRLQDLTGKPEYPVFVAEVDNSRKYIIGLYGAGLWGPLWGYLALNDDVNTIFGTNLSHAGETPGLGAEIATPHFTDEFVGKQIYRDGELRSIAIVKPGKSASDKDYVDGISGGTLTSQGVDHMLLTSLKLYEPYLKTLKK